MIDSVTGWSETTEYDDKRAISIAKSVETTWLTIYPRPMKNTYDQRTEFIGHELRKLLIETEYGITANPRTLGNHISNKILEQIQQVLGNLAQIFKISENYVDEYDPW